MHQKNIIYQGKPLTSDSRVLIMLHGRGATASDILSLAGYLNTEDFTLIAPQATNNTWYPYSFLAPTVQNEPWLSSALSLLKALLEDLNGEGIPSEKIYLLGFSQGACLTLEFAARNARRFGGIIAFTGGLIGESPDRGHYTGNFQQTPVFIGSSDPDPHVPVERVEASRLILADMGADIEIRIYPRLGHTISEDAMAYVNQWIFPEN